MGGGGGDRGFTLIEVLLAIALLVVGVLALLGLLSSGSVSVVVGGGQSKAAAYAREKVEELRNQPISAPCPPQGCFPSANGTDTPEVGVTRTWTIAQVGATLTPNRLWRITVTVAVNQGSTVGGQNITLETMRAE